MTGTTLTPGINNSQTNQVNYAISQALMNVNTVLPCKIIEVNANNTYTVQSLVNYLDADGTPHAPPIVYGVVANQLVASNAGVIIEWGINDIVTVGFCQRDITTVKKTWTQQNPSSLRKFALNDGIILGNPQNKQPSVIVKITPSGIEMSAPDLPINLNCGSLSANVTNSATVTANQVDIKSGNINLGENGVGILNANTQFQVVGVQGGGATLPVTIVNNTESQTVKASS